MKKETKPWRLIFVYNADSGLGSLLLDGAHKILSPGTYDCKLCKLTFGAFTEKKAWKKFRIETQLQMEFLHRDEFKRQYASKFGHKFTFPIVLMESALGLEVLIGAGEMSNVENVKELIDLINSRI